MSNGACFHSPYFKTSDQAKFCAEVMLLLNKSVDEWLDCCEAEGDYDENEDATYVFFMYRACVALLPESY